MMNMGTFLRKLMVAWRVRVFPNKNWNTNFFSERENKVQGKIVNYSTAKIRVLQCTNLYSEDHKVKSPLCIGIRDWNNYCI